MGAHAVVASAREDPGRVLEELPRRDRLALRRPTDLVAVGADTPVARHDLAVAGHAVAHVRQHVVVPSSAGHAIAALDVEAAGLEAGVLDVRGPDRVVSGAAGEPVVAVAAR